MVWNKKVVAFHKSVVRTTHKVHTVFNGIAVLRLVYKHFCHDFAQNGYLDDGPQCKVENSETCTFMN